MAARTLPGAVDVSAAILHDNRIQKLSGDELRSFFEGVIAGEIESPHFRPCYLRPDRWEWRATRRRIFERDGFACRYCGAQDAPLECDHIIPVSRGGTHDDGNLLTACRSCNRAKGSKLPGEWH